MTLHGAAAAAASIPPLSSVSSSRHPSSLAKKSSNKWIGAIESQQDPSPFLVSVAHSTSAAYRPSVPRPVAPGPVSSSVVLTSSASVPVSVFSPPPPSHSEASRFIQSSSAVAQAKAAAQMAAAASSSKRPSTPIRAARSTRTAVTATSTLALSSSSPAAVASPEATLRRGHPASDHVSSSYATSRSRSTPVATGVVPGNIDLATSHYYKYHSSPMNSTRGGSSRLPGRSGTRSMYERLLANGVVAAGHAMAMSSEADVDDGDGSCGRAERNGLPAKGLRQFSLRVCKKVEEKGITTYNEVADDLVKDLGGEIGKGDQKNIRRRVYDALNVLMAMDIIRKEKKEIIWLGLPNDLAQDLESYQNEKQLIQARLLQKKKTLQEMVLRQTALKNLIQRNKAREEALVANAVASGLPPASVLPSAQDILHLPFILINAPRDCRINCEMLEDRSHYFFEFDAPFLIHEDIEILRLMGLCQINPPPTPSASSTQSHATTYPHAANSRLAATNPHVQPPAKRISPRALSGKVSMSHHGQSSHILDPNEQMSEFFNMSVDFPDIHELDFDALPDLDPLLTLFQEDPSFPPIASSIPTSGSAGFSTTFRYDDPGSSVAEPPELSFYSTARSYTEYSLSSEANKSHPSLSSSVNAAFNGLRFDSEPAAVDENDMEALMQARNYHAEHGTPSKRFKESSDAAAYKTAYSSPVAPSASPSQDDTMLEANPITLAKQRSLRRKLPL